MAAEIGLEPGTIIDLCDSLIGGPARRQHRFAWLRDPADAGEWLAVDGYYPAQRLVVALGGIDPVRDGAVAASVHAQGLRLLAPVPSQLGPDPVGARDALARMLDALGPPPDRAHAPVGAPAPRPRPPRPQPPRRNGSTLLSRPGSPAGSPPRLGKSHAEAARRAARMAATHPPAPRAPAASRRPVAAAAPLPTVGLEVGVVLVLVEILEIYVGAVLLGIDTGRVVLAFGLALDACARALGTIAAERRAEPDWSWSCALIGSPAVCLFARYRDGGRVTTEPAPLAGMVALVACWVLALALVGDALGA